MAFEDKTPDLLHAAMLDSVRDDVDKREGSVVHDLTYPAAIELAHAYVELDSVLGLGFAETTEGIYLDYRAGEFGLKRKPAIKAQGSVTLTGPDDTDVPAGTRVQTDNDVFFVTKAAATLIAGTATVEAEAELAGVDGNVAAGAISALAPGSLYGVVSVTNSEPFDGGADTESDAELLQRLKTRVQRPATSGNVAHYEQWALEVAGVGNVKVYPVANGPGTVKVVLLDTQNTAPAQPIIDAAIAHIEANRPIGAAVEVIGATEVPINISATLSLVEGKTADDAIPEITELVSEYLKTLAFVDPIVRYAKIAALVLDAESVLDYANLTINGGTANITIADGSVAVAGTVSV